MEYKADHAEWILPSRKKRERSPVYVCTYIVGGWNEIVNWAGVSW